MTLSQRIKRVSLFGNIAVLLIGVIAGYFLISRQLQWQRFESNILKRSDLIQELSNSRGFSGFKLHIYQYSKDGLEDQYEMAESTLNQSKMALENFINLNDLSQNEKKATKSLSKVLDESHKDLIKLKALWHKGKSNSEIFNKMSSINNLFSNLGYGGLIHHFKDYLLYGRQFSFYEFNQSKDNIIKVLSNYRSHGILESKEEECLLFIEDLIAQYSSSIVNAQNLWKKGRSPEEVMLKMQIIDHFHKIYGYGGFIHDFKNYILRHKKLYYNRFMAEKDVVNELLFNYRSRGELTDFEEETLVQIEDLTKAYTKAILKARTLIKEGKSIEEIDQEVKVDDAPYIYALDNLVKYLDRSIEESKELYEIIKINDSPYLFSLGELKSLLRQSISIKKNIETNMLDKEDSFNLALSTLRSELKFMIDNENQNINLNLTLSLTLILLSVVLCILLSNHYSNVITQVFQDRIQSFVRSIISFEKNYYKDTTLLRGFNDELGEVSSTFNQMAMKVRETINALDKSNNEKRDALKDAKVAQVAKDNFLATMSHEIRTPMNGMLVMAELLAESDLSKEQQEYANVIKNSGKDLLKVINDILDYTRLEASRLELEYVTFDLKKTIFDIDSLLSPLAQKNQVQLNHHFQSNLPHIRVGDPSKLKQVITNLINNAIKFSPGGTVMLNVSGQDGPSKRSFIRFEITDNGIGISKESQNKLFSPFTQADSSVNRKYGGTGLGLAICRKIVETMGGDIGVKSKVGEGSTFWFELNLAISDDLNSIGKEVSEIKNIEESIPMTDKMLKILVVDDNAINLKVAYKMLKKLGHDVTPVSSGSEALTLCNQFLYDIIFMDLQMPQMDGFQTTTFIRDSQSLNVDTPIIALTANVFKEDKERSYNAGMNDFITKPINKSVMIEIIRKYSRC